MTFTPDERVLSLDIAVPEPGQQVTVRGHPWVVRGVVRSKLPPPTTRPDDYRPSHLVTLISLDDDRWEHEIQIIWELEPGRRIHQRATLPSPNPDTLDDPDVLAAFLDAVRWGAVTSADSEALQAPFRSGITIEDYQLEPLVRALRMPRVNLLIADDVGLGKTIEAGLVAQELILRHRARTALVICPAPLQQKWQAEMDEKFGLHFEIINTEYVKTLRRTRGIRANPWTSYPRMITSLDWVKSERPLRLLREVLPSEITYPRQFDLLIIDEVHNVAPSATGRYATDSLRTQAVREIAPHFEHRLYLSATPHNGYEESWTALLELLDPQRFARGVKPDDNVRDEVVIRRLKSQFIDNDSDEATSTTGSRFARRVIHALEVNYPDDERQAHADLQAYVKLREKESGTSKLANSFVYKLLKKRLFSSPSAFHQTLRTHRDTIQRGHAGSAISEKALRSVLSQAEDDYATDDALDQAEADGLAAAARTVPELTSEQSKILDRLVTWSQRAGEKADAKTAALIEWLTEIVKTGGRWNDERVIIFTEYRDTQKYLVDQLTAAGLAAGGRLQTLYGGQDDQEREDLKAAFQSDPELNPVRILLATDTASEGIDLQKRCHRLVHVEIPWNPNRLEQRNGRIDRHGQPNPTADIFHFVGSGYEGAEPGSLEADLEFLARAAAKIERIRNDLGSAGPVIAEQVEEAMLWSRSRFDERSVDQTVASRAKLSATERRLREKVKELTKQLSQSQKLLGITPDHLERAVSTALTLDHQPKLQPTTIDRNGESHRVLRVPALDRGWSRTKERGLLHPLTKDELPVTFDHDLAAGQDDVALAHLGHPLVQKSLSSMRSEIWVQDNPRMSRVSTAVVPDSLLSGDDGIVIAHGRLVITGSTGSRLHEALITAGGQVRNGKWNLLRVDQVNQFLSESDGATVESTAVGQITDHWPNLQDNVWGALRRRESDVANGLARTFELRAKQDAEAVTKILTELQTGIEKLLVSPEFEQLRFDLDTSGKAGERAQLKFDEDALRRRLNEIPGEIERETKAVQARYQDQRTRMFPAAITLILPESNRREPDGTTP